MTNEHPKSHQTPKKFEFTKKAHEQKQKPTYVNLHVYGDEAKYEINSIHACTMMMFKRI